MIIQNKSNSRNINVDYIVELIRSYSYGYLEYRAKLVDGTWVALDEHNYDKAYNYLNKKEK